MSWLELKTFYFDTMSNNMKILFISKSLSYQKKSIFDIYIQQLYLNPPNICICNWCNIKFRCVEYRYRTLVLVHLPRVLVLKSSFAKFESWNQPLTIVYWHSQSSVLILSTSVPVLSEVLQNLRVFPTNW